MSLIIAVSDFVDAYVNDEKTGNNGSTKPLYNGSDYFVTCWTNKNHGQGTEFCEYQVVRHEGGNQFRAVHPNHVPQELQPYLRDKVTTYLNFYRLPSIDI
ncbi:hypothetical protein ABGV42_00225 [Paenibacillus pabuli]|uniref:hypothetical protein n=1 Tax=Paenibacillus pabuli TaxID=1472 RepID=UPI00324290BA